MTEDMIFEESKVNSRKEIGRKNLHNTTTINDNLIKGNEASIEKHISDMLKVMKPHMTELSSALATPGPEKRIMFSKVHERKFIDATGVKFETVTKTIKECKMIGSTFLTQNNEFYILMSAMISYFHRNKARYKDVNLAKTMTFYMGLRIYKAAFSAFFPSYLPNPEVMSATIEQLNSNRFNIKKYKTIFNTILYISESHYERFEDILDDPIDDNIIYYMINIYNRIKLMMRTISNIYYENHRKGVKQGTETNQGEDSEGEAYLKDVENVSSLILVNSRKIYLSFISDRVANPKILKTVCNMTKISFSKMTITVNKIIESRDPLIEELIMRMLSHYYSLGNAQIKSTKFVKVMTEVYSVSNSSDESVLAVKRLLETIMKSYSKDFLLSNNVSTLSNLKKTLLLYISFYCVSVV